MFQLFSFQFYFEIDFEKKVLSAAAQVQEQLKCPVSIHPGRNSESPSEVLRILQEAGGNADKLALCHLDSKIILKLFTNLPLLLLYVLRIP